MNRQSDGSCCAANPVHQYLHQFEFKPRFSEPIYQPSQADGLLRFVDVKYPDTNAIYTYVFSLFLSIQTSVAATLLTLTDLVSNRPVYIFNQLINNNGHYPLFVINKGARIAMSITTDQAVSFTIGYQWVYADK